MSQQHSTHITFTVGTVDDYDKEKLICALEGFANQFDLIDASKKIRYGIYVRSIVTRLLYVSPSPHILSEPSDAVPTDDDPQPDNLDLNDGVKVMSNDDTILDGENSDETEVVVYAAA